MTPIFSSLGGLLTARVLFTLALSAMLVSVVGPSGLGATTSLADLISASIAELVVGGTLAFGVFASFGAVTLAGKLIDIQSGLGLGAVFDPVTRVGAPLFGTLLNLVALAIFFAVDGHHAFLRGIAFSVQQVPLGTGFSTLPLDAVMRQFGLMFSLGVALVAPVIFVLFFVEVALAVMSRVLPQMNVFLVSVPLKIAIAIAMLAASAAPLGHVLERVPRSSIIGNRF
jgi:flagellar biosynthetic protein FliR